VLYLVLILVITAFGLLIAALTTAHTVWAWISVAISVVAAGLLVFDWLRGRRRVAAISAQKTADQEEVEPLVEDVRAAELPPVESTTEIPPVEPEVDADPVAAAEAASPEPDDEEPDEEATDAADRLVVSDLSVEVRVVDEHPRYHLARCTWLAGKPTLPLPISEARQLGFTPCARCGPDAALAAQHRASRGAER
jgi:hypothetical protein